MTIVTSASQVPDGEHFAVLEFDTIYIPGDERSRTNPGHGYPESSETVCRYKVFKTQQELEKYISYFGKNGNFIILKSQKIDYEFKLQLQLKGG